jgi:glycine betaine/proline transport system substrate-binding protein
LLPSAIFKAAWPGFKDKWPAAYEILKGFKLSVDAQEPMIEAIDVDGQSLESVASKWVGENTSTWRPLIDQATK